MTPAQEAKSYGLTSLTQASELTGWSTKALREWHKSNPKRFRIIMQGLAIELGLYDPCVKINNEKWVKK